MRFDITSPSREPIVAEVDRPNDVTGAYIVPSSHCFPPSGAQHTAVLNTAVEDIQQYWTLQWEIYSSTEHCTGRYTQTLKKFVYKVCGPGTSNVNLAPKVR